MREFLTKLRSKYDSHIIKEKAKPTMYGGFVEVSIREQVLIVLN